MVAGTCGQLDIPKRLEFAAHGGLVKQDPEFRLKPSRQIAQAPAHNPMDRRVWAALHDRRKPIALGVIELRPLARCLAVDQTIWPAGDEPHKPVAHNLQTNAPDPRGVITATAIVNLGQRQEPAGLVRVLRCPRKTAQCCAIMVRPQSYRCTHARPLQKT